MEERPNWTKTILKVPISIASFMVLEGYAYPFYFVNERLYQIIKPG